MIHKTHFLFQIHIPKNSCAHDQIKDTITSSTHDCRPYDTDFDAQQEQAQAHESQFEQDQARIAFLEQNVSYITTALKQLQNNVPAPVPQQVSHPNLNLPPPPPFSGSPSNFRSSR